MGEVWRVIAAKGLNANDFQIDPSELRGYEWKLSHKPTGQALYASGVPDGSFYSRADFLRTQPDDEPLVWESANLDQFHEIVKDWANELKTAKTTGQWRGGGPTPIGSAGGQAGENTAFTPAERAEIANQLRAIRDWVRKNYELSAEQLASIGERLEEAEEASKRLGRKDWKSLFYGIVFGLIVNDTIPPDVAQHIFTGVLYGIVHLLGSGIPPGAWLLGR
jgi:hypothetical protein